MSDLYAHRKATARIKFTDKAGAPLSDADVKVKLKNHKFLFGVGAYDFLPPDEIDTEEGKSLADYIIEYEGQRAFLLADGDSSGTGEALVFTQKDIREVQPTDDDPTPDVLMFIGRFSTDGHRERVQVVEAFTQGCCFWFARILEERFRDQYGAHIVVDYVANHFATRIGGDRVYDITGDVTEGHTWEPWAACSDHLLRQRITDDCIMF